jgi:opacity protein-like surface antigen
MIILSFLILLLFPPLMSEEFSSMSEEFDDIEQMIQKLEQEVDEPAKTPTPVKNSVEKAETSSNQASIDKEKNLVFEENSTDSAFSDNYSDNYIDEKSYKLTAKEASIKDSLSGPSNFSSPAREVDMDRDDVYHYSYMPPLKGEEYDESGAFKGSYGHLVFTVYGSYVIYYKATSNRSAFGGDVQFGWQFDLSPVAIALLVDAGVRASNISANNIYTLGPRARVTIRANEWFFPFLEGGVEFGKVESMSNWVYPFTVFAGGFMFKIGSLDKRSEYSLYRDYSVSRMLIIVAGEIITSPELNVNTPDSGLIKVGLSLELF